MSSTAITNLRNRIEATKKKDGYNERMFVDAPVHELEAMLDRISKLEEVAKAAVLWTENVRPQGNSEHALSQALEKLKSKNRT